MRNSIIDDAIGELMQTPLTSYRISKDIGVSETIVAKWRRRECRPTRTNAVALLRYFRGDVASGTPPKRQSRQSKTNNQKTNNQKQEVVTQQETSTTEQPVGVSDKMISFLIDQCQLKDTQLNEARRTIEELQRQINQLKNM